MEKYNLSEEEATQLVGQELIDDEDLIEGD